MTNPFRLIGSYIGLLVGIILSYFVYSAILVICEFLVSCKPIAYIFVLIPLVVGFFIGYFIHLLIRMKK